MTDGSRDIDGPMLGRGLLVLAGAAILLTSLNLRPAITSVGALLPELQSALAMGGGTAGALTSLPPVCFALAGLVAGRLGRRWGPTPAVVLAMMLVGAGLLGRALVDETWSFLALTLPALAGIGIGNVVLPVAVKGYFPRHVGWLTGVYSLGLALGTAGAAAVTVPVAEAAGTWRAGVGMWAVPGLLALVPWLVLAGRSRRLGEVDTPSAQARAAARSAEDRRRRQVRTNPQSWALAGFFGLQALTAYTVMGWLPAIYQEAGLSPARAALMLAITTGIGAPIGLLLPALAARYEDQRWWPVGLAVCAAAAYVGLLAAPAAAPVAWAALLGVAMGAFPLALLLIGLRAHSAEGTAMLSTMTQTLGYALAAAGPIVVGALHDATGTWSVPLILLLVLLVPQTLCGVIAGRAGHVDLPASASASIH